ncbi:DNA replication/repair protein RecF [Facilibium subflavum]|uniref:DNA replication/repair protein RecF n=1 Tax=Facilibium subflavum TaxID=2219058 RepID=UPI000E64F1DB|nr:DNA replication/repair protein RecF [Facilibium subflavum]
MHLTHLNIHHFRNIVFADLPLHSRFNLIYGNNGSGKTSILEAIYFLSLGRSFRSAQLSRIIQYEAQNFQLFGRFFDQTELTIGSMRERNGKSVIKLNGEAQLSQSVLTQAFPVQLFNPESFNLLNSGAQQRCKFLDWGAFYYDNAFLKTWQQVKRLVKQRNAALKQQFPRNYIEILENELVEKSQSLHIQRQNYFDKLAPKVQEILSVFSNQFAIQMSYFKGWSSDKPLSAVLAEHYIMDVKTGITNHGPHRADLRFKVNGHPAQDILSRGQQKLLICAIKLAQGALFSQKRKTGCLYLVDDLHSELDQTHLSHLFEKLMQTNGQVIATCIERSHLSDLFKPYDAQYFHVNNGRLCDTKINQENLAQQGSSEKTFLSAGEQQ